MLSKSQSHYIRTIHELTLSGDQGVRVVDIADRMGLSKASVYLAAKKLEQDKLVCRNERRLIFLTSRGMALAVCVLEQRRIVQRFLADYLGLDAEVTQAEACHERSEYGNKPRLVFSWPVEKMTEGESALTIFSMAKGSRCSNEYLPLVSRSESVTPRFNNLPYE